MRSNIHSNNQFFFSLRWALKCPTRWRIYFFWKKFACRKENFQRKIIFFDMSVWEEEGTWNLAHARHKDTNTSHCARNWISDWVNFWPPYPATPLDSIEVERRNFIAREILIYITVGLISSLYFWDELCIYISSSYFYISIHISEWRCDSDFDENWILVAIERWP
jgi:hypothetical protein